MLARWQHADNLSLKPEKRFELPPWWTNIWRCWKDVGSVRSMQEPAWDCVRGWRKILGCLKHEDIQVEISLSHWRVKRHSADSTWFRWYLQLVETLLDWNVPKAFKSIPKARARWCQVNRLVFLKLPTTQHEDTSTLISCSVCNHSFLREGAWSSLSQFTYSSFCHDMLRTFICVFLHFVFKRRPTLFSFNLPFSRLCQDLNLHWCGPKSQLHLRSGQVVFVGPGCEISSSLGRTSQLSFLNQKLLPGVGKRETDRLVNQVDSAMPSRWNPSHQFYWIPGLAQRCTATLSAVTCRFSSWNKIFSQISKVAAKCNVQKVAWKIQSKWEPQPCFLLGEESICAPSRAMDFKVQPDFLALWKSLLLHWGKLRCLDAEGFPDSNWWSWTW